MVALPWMMLTQVVVTLTAPAADLYLLSMLATGDNGTLVRVLALAAALDIVITAAVVVAERESVSLLLAAPLLRWVWRPLQILAVVGATRQWARGETQRWQPSVRYDSVDLPQGRYLTVSGDSEQV
jgi:hypothetical protein